MWRAGQPNPRHPFIPSQVATRRDRQRGSGHDARNRQITDTLKPHIATRRNHLRGSGHDARVCQTCTDPFITSSCDTAQPSEGLWA